MADQEPLSTGNVTYIGGMDTSRSPVEIDETQFARAANLVIPRSLGGIKVRPGFIYQHCNFATAQERTLFEGGKIQAEGWFRSGRQIFLVAVVDGVVIRFTRLSGSAWSAKFLNVNDKNTGQQSWITRIPDGVIVNDGINNPLIVKADTIRRSRPADGEISPGRAGVYCQNRFFYISSDGRGIRFSDFLNPVGEKEGRLAGIDRFVAPEDQDEIIAITRQKVMLDYVTGGAVLFSTRINIYSIDVRGDLLTWRVLNTRVGKVTESVTELSACSPYAFEPFGANVYFRSGQYGMCDLRQSQYQFNQFDSTTGQSIEASYFFDSDTDWMLDRCYMRGYKSRLLITVAPEQNENGYLYWNGILSCHPDSSVQGRQALARRFESVFTGVRPVAMTSVKQSNRHDELFIWSYDKDGINRLYALDDKLDFDLNHKGQKIEIEGWLELRGYNFGNKTQLKETQAVFYQTYTMPRDVSLCFFARTQATGQWEPTATRKHLIDHINIEEGKFSPQNIHGQMRGPVNLPSEEFKCNAKSWIYIQDRIEFKGPFYLDHFVRVANVKTPNRNMPPPEKRTKLIYSARADYTYSVALATP